MNAAHVCVFGHDIQCLQKYIGTGIFHDLFADPCVFANIGIKCWIVAMLQKIFLSFDFGAFRVIGLPENVNARDDQRHDPEEEKRRENSSDPAHECHGRCRHFSLCIAMHACPSNVYTCTCAIATKRAVMRDRLEMIMLLLALFLLVYPETAGGELLAIGDQGYPHIYLMQPPAAVQWHEKVFALKIASAQAVRINSRGIRFISAGYSSLVLTHDGNEDTRDEEQDNYGRSRRKAIISSITHEYAGEGKGGGEWRSIHCEGARDSLCHIVDSAETDKGQQVITGRAFPNAGQVAYVGHGLSRSYSVLENLGIGRCPESSTGRTAGVVGGGIANASSVQWDITICNVLGGGGDFVYVPDEQRLYALGDPISFQMFAAISVLTILMAIILAHNLEYSLGTTKYKPTAAGSLFGMISLLMCVTFATGKSNFLLPYVTVEDRLAFVTLFAYVGYYSIRIATETMHVHVWWYVKRMGLWVYGLFSRCADNNNGSGENNGRDEERNIAGGAVKKRRMHLLRVLSPDSHVITGSPVNPVLATLCIVALRLFSTLDNPYTTALVFLIATRLLHKITKYLDDSACVQCNAGDRRCRLHASVGAWGCMDILFDCFIVSMLIYAGVVPQNNNDPSTSSLFILQGIFAAATLNRIITVYENNASVAVVVNC